MAHSHCSWFAPESALFFNKEGDRRGCHSAWQSLMTPELAERSARVNSVVVQLHCFNCPVCLICQCMQLTRLVHCKGFPNIKINCSSASSLFKFLRNRSLNLFEIHHFHVSTKSFALVLGSPLGAMPSVRDRCIHPCKLHMQVDRLFEVVVESNCTVER